MALVRAPGGVAAAAHRRGVRGKARDRPLGGVEVGPGENILLDAGSTVGALAHELRTADASPWRRPA